MGRRWYEDGKLLHKTNTFVACTEHLASVGRTAPSRLIARGGPLLVSSRLPTRFYVQ